MQCQNVVNYCGFKYFLSRSRLTIDTVLEQTLGYVKKSETSSAVLPFFLPAKEVYSSLSLFVTSVDYTVVSSVSDGADPY